MKIGNYDTNNDVFFIVEEGQFNLGNFDHALFMIELVSKTGANAIEFQLAYANDFYINSDPGFDIYKKREFTDDQLKKLVDFAKSKNLEFIATCLSHNLVPKMAKLGTSGFNLNASDINNSIILDKIIDTRLPFFVSTPLATQQEINWAVNRIKSKARNSSFAILHGQHPMASGHEWVSTEDTSLGFISTLKQQFNIPIGFIDHTPFEWMPSAAVAAGAQIISKHMSPSKIYNGPDWQICLEPTEMKRAITNARGIRKSITIKDKQLAKGEDLDRTVMRRSIVSVRKIKAGNVISWEHVAFKRPGSGIPPDMIDNIIGKKALVDINSDTLINFEMIEK